MEANNIYDKIQELFGAIPAKLSILQEQIDIGLQVEYFELSKKHKQQKACIDTERYKESLLSNKSSVDDKKEALIHLASIEDVDAYRAIESFLTDPGEDLKDWATLALQESRMLLESNLLDETQLLISTGLGGKGSKLRYFLVLLARGEIEFDDTRKKIVQGEFEYMLNKNEAEIENIMFYPRFIAMMVILPLYVAIKDLFKRAIEECNQYGDFMQDTFILTNVKQLSEEEINALLERKHAWQEPLE